TFCIVPYVRGRERSLPGRVLVAQVRALAAAGVREVVFLGQTVNAYHDGAWDFAELLRRAAEVPGILRIRFTSPHPSDMSPRVIEAMAECSPVAPQLHLPVQSGSDRVPDDEKARRLQRLVALQESISAEINRRLVGGELEVLVEGPARRTAGWMTGKSPQMKTVVFPGPAEPGDLVRVRIEAATSHTLT